MGIFLEYYYKQRIEEGKRIGRKIAKINNERYWNWLFNTPIIRNIVSKDLDNLPPNATQEKVDMLNKINQEKKFVFITYETSILDIGLDNHHKVASVHNSQEEANAWASERNNETALDGKVDSIGGHLTRDWWINISTKEVAPYLLWGGPYIPELILHY